MPWHLRDSRNVAVIAASLVAACGDDPADARPPEPNEVVQPAYSAEQFDNVRAGLEDASHRVVAGIAEEATARAVQTALTRLLEELGTNNPIRIRLAIDNALGTLNRLATSDKALEDAAELEAVKLVLSNAAELLPVQLSQ
jgi:hypothetical protein